MSKQSGHPAKQPRPDGKTPTDQVTGAFPPSLSGVITEFGTSVVPFPFVGGKGIQLEASCGPLKVHLVLEPQFAETVCDAIMGAKANAESKVTPATMMDLQGIGKA